ncbi:helix-turn-helix domain-containing protein [Hydrogenophaga sp.]|uniref:helix-turn-helix domain-containing protein n=1 Tax=Hydrogenophaga sp. TaxID=1904254 RepID=UPI00351D35C6
MSKTGIRSTALPLQQLRSTAQLGLILRSARKARGLNQAELASRLNLSQSRVSQLELQPENMTADQLLTWCAVLGVTLTVGDRPTSTVPHALSVPAQLAEKTSSPKLLLNSVKGPRKGSW